MNRFLLLAICLAAASTLPGCGNDNPTNEPTPDSIQSANAKRAAAIDADPTMTPEGKKTMKEHLGLTGKGSDAPARPGQK